VQHQYWWIFGQSGVVLAALLGLFWKRFQMSMAMKYGISSIPTMNVFVGGEVVKTIVGAKPKPALLKDLESYIK
jgi:hypothetical protein